MATITYKIKKFPFGFKKVTRQQTPGVEEMLNSQPDKEVLVSIRNVDVTYGHGAKEFRAVSDLNLNIYKNEVLGLVGESGSGKSTIGRTLVGLVPHSFGEIKLLDKVLPRKLNSGIKFGKKLQEYKEIENFLVNKVQMIFQDPANSLNPHVNIETIVSEGLVNIKNSKEIYLLNFDQEAKKQIYEQFSKKQYPQFFGQYEEELDRQIFINSEIAYQKLYEDFLKEFINLQDTKMIEFIENAMEERKAVSNFTEKEYRKILVRDMLKAVGLDESVLTRFPLEFSGGQQQRIGISRAIVVRPQLLVADEPISALDVSIQAQVVNIFNELKEKYQLTILFIAHDLRMVEYISDRIAVMNKGRLLEIGKTEEIIYNSLHPYTKSLLDAVPSIEAKKGSLIGYVYDIKMHKYNKKNQPQWIKISDDHFVLGTPEEVKKWQSGKY